MATRLSTFDAGVLLALDRGESVEEISRAFRTDVTSVVKRLEKRGLARSGRTTTEGRNALIRGGWGGGSSWGRGP